MQCSNYTLGHLSQRIENLCSHKSPHMISYSCFIRNIQNLETLQMSFNRQIIKQSVVYIHTIIPKTTLKINPKRLHAV